jgi:hypothetical protein
VIIHSNEENITFFRSGKGSCLTELDDCILDIVFSNGKLYALTQGEGLYMLELAEEKDGKPVVSSIQQLIDDCHYPSLPMLDIFAAPCAEEHYLRHYLVESCGQLLMVRRWLDDPYEVNAAGDGKGTRSFEVFTLNSMCDGWMEQKDLNGEALLSRRASVSVAPSSCDGARANCIYFVHDAMARQAMVEDPFHDSAVYNMRDSTVAPLPQVKAPTRGRWFPS